MTFVLRLLQIGLSTVFAGALALFVGGILAAISMMFIEPRHSHHADQRHIDSSNLRQIGQASLIFAADNHDRLPDATDLPDYARQLAIGGGLNDASIWISARESTNGVETVLLPAPAGDPRALDPRFAELPHLFTVVIGGLKMADPATTPIAWTRGLDLETGVWSKASPYGGKGGHIVFIGGNVTFFRTLQNSSGGELVSRDGRATHRIRDALPVGARIYADPTTLTATDKPSQPWSERIPRWLKTPPKASASPSRSLGRSGSSSSGCASPSGSRARRGFPSPKPACSTAAASPSNSRPSCSSSLA